MADYESGSWLRSSRGFGHRIWHSTARGRHCTCEVSSRRERGELPSSALRGRFSRCRMEASRTGFLKLGLCGVNEYPASGRFPLGKGFALIVTRRPPGADGSTAGPPIGRPDNDIIQLRCGALSEYRPPEVMSLQGLEGLPGGGAGGSAAVWRPRSDRPVSATGPSG